MKKRAWHAENTDRVKVYAGAYYTEHANTLRAKSRIKMRAWVANNPERKRLADKAYAAAHPEVRRAAQERWRQRHPEIVSATSRLSKYRRRALFKKVERAPYDYTTVVYGAIACGLCGLAYVESDVRSLDHIIPITRGGGDIPENVQSAHWLCNVRKGNRV